MQSRSDKPSQPTRVLPTRPAALQPAQRNMLPARVLESTRAPQQLCLPFHR
jgi:hypothetical protein